MQRYGGEHLGDAPHIVVLGSCKVGNLVVSLPTLEGLRKRFPGATIGFLGSTVTADLEAALPAIDWRASWDDPHPQAFAALASTIDTHTRAFGAVDLAINLDGFNPVTQVLASFLAPRYVAGGALTANRRRSLPWGDQPQQAFLADSDWNSPDFAARYAPLLRSNYIAELFAAIAWVSHDCDPAQISLPSSDPPFAVPDLLIHCTTARAAKIWPFHHWKQVVDACRDLSISVGLIGSPPQQQQLAYHSGSGEEQLLSETHLIDLRGSTTLLQLAGACAKARAVISVDAGPLHIAAAVGTPTLAIVGNDSAGIGASPVGLWMPRSANVSCTQSSVTCCLCRDARFSNDGCLAESHACMEAVGPDQVIGWLRQQLA
jgi:heptosyltransferase-3